MKALSLLYKPHYNSHDARKAYQALGMPGGPCTSAMSLAASARLTAARWLWSSRGLRGVHGTDASWKRGAAAPNSTSSSGAAGPPAAAARPSAPSVSRRRRYVTCARWLWTSRDLSSSYLKHNLGKHSCVVHRAQGVAQAPVCHLRERAVRFRLQVTYNLAARSAAAMRPSAPSVSRRRQYITCARWLYSSRPQGAPAGPLPQH